VFDLIARRIRRKKKGATRAEPVSHTVEREEVKSAAADLTQVPDDKLEAVIAGSRVLDEERRSA